MNRPPPPPFPVQHGGERQTGVQFVQPSIEHGHRTIKIPDVGDFEEGGDGPYVTGAMQIWPLASWLKYLQVQIAPTATGGPWFVQVWDLSAADPDPVTGDAPLLLVPGVTAAGTAWFSEPQMDHRGFPFDRGIRAYVSTLAVWGDADYPLACLRARVKVERCLRPCCNEREG